METSFTTDFYSLPLLLDHNLGHHPKDISLLQDPLEYSCEYGFTPENTILNNSVTYNNINIRWQLPYHLPSTSPNGFQVPALSHGDSVGSIESLPIEDIIPIELQPQDSSMAHRQSSQLGTKPFPIDTFSRAAEHIVYGKNGLAISPDLPRIINQTTNETGHHLQRLSTQQADGAYITSNFQLDSSQDALFHYQHCRPDDPVSVTLDPQELHKAQLWFNVQAQASLSPILLSTPTHVPNTTQHKPTGSFKGELQGQVPEVELALLPADGFSPPPPDASTICTTDTNGKTKRRRRRKPPPPPEVVAAKRRAVLQRNREAASKCRLKKKSQIDELREAEMRSRQRNRDLRIEISTLLDEVLLLREQVKLKVCSDECSGGGRQHATRTKNSILRMTDEIIESASTSLLHDSIRKQSDSKEDDEVIVDLGGI